MSEEAVLIPNKGENEAEIDLEDVSDFPILDAVPEKFRQKENVLSQEELIDQTYAFMESFREPLAKGEAPDTIFFTLKSTLPAVRMMKKMWNDFYPGVTMPEVRFVDVGRIKSSEIQYSYNERTSKITKTHFGPVVGGPEVDVIREKFKNNINTNGRMLVIDEWSESGKTIQEADRLLSQAFPDASIQTKVIYTKRPHWYDMTSYLGIRDATVHDNDAQALDITNNIAFQRFLGKQKSEELHKEPHKWREAFESWKKDHGYGDEFDMMGSAEGHEDRRKYLELTEKFKNSPYRVIHPEPGNDYDEFNEDVYELARYEEASICRAVVNKLHHAQAA